MEFKVEDESYKVGKLLNLRKICLTELSDNEVGYSRALGFPVLIMLKESRQPCIRES